MINDPAEADMSTRYTPVQGRTASPDRVVRVLTEAEITDVIQSYRSGATSRELAARYGVHVQTIKKKLRKHGVRRTCGEAER